MKPEKDPEIKKIKKDVERLHDQMKSCLEEIFQDLYFDELQSSKEAELDDNNRKSKKRKKLVKGK